MRILIYNWKDMKHPAAGGAEVFVHEVASRWVKWGHEVTLFCAAVEGAPEYDSADGVKIIRRGSRFGVYREARKFYEREGRGKFDAVLDSVNTRPFLTPSFVDDVPVGAIIYQLCADVWPLEFPFPASALGRYVFEPRWLGAYRNVPVATISESSKMGLETYQLKHVSIVSIGVTGPPAPVVVEREQVPTLIFVGRLSRNKRPNDAISAFIEARKTMPSLKMWVVGSGPLEKTLRQQRTSGVEFHGRVSQVRKFELMARAHALLVTSVREGWGLIVTEASLVGTPAIAYDVPGLRDSVADAGYGILCDSSPSAMAQNIVAMMNEPLKAYPKARQREWDETAKGIFDALLGEKLASSGPGVAT